MTWMMRLPAPLFALVLFAGAASAQGQLAFESEAHDFGRLAEAEPATWTFRFTNAGDAPLRLTRVDAACGCTTPSWTDTPVPPGGAGTVEVVFDPEGRAGPFQKTVFVAAEGAEPVTLRIAGTVVPSFVEGGVAMGALTFDRDRADAVAEGDAAQASFRFANTGARPVRVERVDAPAGVEVVFPETPVFPDQTGGLFVIVGDVSLDEVALDVVTTDAAMPVKRVTVRVVPPRPDGE